MAALVNGRRSPDPQPPSAVSFDMTLPDGHRWSVPPMFSISPDSRFLVYSDTKAIYRIGFHPHCHGRAGLAQRVFNYIVDREAARDHGLGARLSIVGTHGIESNSSRTPPTSPVGVTRNVIATTFRQTADPAGYQPTPARNRRKRRKPEAVSVSSRRASSQAGRPAASSSDPFDPSRAARRSGGDRSRDP